jgi:hypothetical protein
MGTTHSLTAAEREALRTELLALARKFAGPGTDDGTCTDGHRDDEIKNAHLAHLKVLADIRRETEISINGEVLEARRHGASTKEIAPALGITRQAADKRWGHAQDMERVAVVISRRDRVHDDGQGRTYGEVGGPSQYDSDRLEWRVGEDVRNLARYAIIAVDGIVQRVYQIAPEGWHQTSPGYWGFHAIGDRARTDTEIDAAYAAGDLPLRPGDDCPTRAGGAYRPHWF